MHENAGVRSMGCQIVIALAAGALLAAAPPGKTTYPIVDTGQGSCYEASGASAACAARGEALYGQDAQASGNRPSYTDNGDGTITDNVTGRVTSIANEAGVKDYPAYWSSTTHASFANGRNAAYVNFGRSLGYMGGTWVDIHGAGAQRSDPKSGNPADDPTGRGPQGDAIRIYNRARCVRGGEVTATPAGYPTHARDATSVEVTRVSGKPPGRGLGLPLTRSRP